MDLHMLITKVRLPVGCSNSILSAVRRITSPSVVVLLLHEYLWTCCAAATGFSIRLSRNPLQSHLEGPVLCVQSITLITAASSFKVEICVWLNGFLMATRSFQPSQDASVRPLKFSSSKKRKREKKARVWKIGKILALVINDGWLRFQKEFN